MTITKIIKDFPSNYLNDELESRNPYLARGILRAISTEDILLELEYRKSHSITNNKIFKCLRIKYKL